MTRRFKIIHPAHIRAWSDIHAHPDSGRTVRRANSSDVDAPRMDGYDRVNGCVVVVVTDVAAGRGV